LPTRRSHEPPPSAQWAPRTERRDCQVSQDASDSPIELQHFQAALLATLLKVPDLPA
jgi:hypothetical protein